MLHLIISQRNLVASNEGLLEEHKEGFNQDKSLAFDDAHGVGKMHEIVKGSSSGAASIRHASVRNPTEGREEEARSGEAMGGEAQGIR